MFLLFSLSFSSKTQHFFHAISPTDRFMPLCSKNFDIVFAKSHFIEEGHAVRTVDSRLGTSFHFVLMFAIIALFVMVFVDDPNTIKTASLKPISSVQTNTTTYGHVNLTITTYAPRTDAFEACSSDIVVDQTNGFNCVAKMKEVGKEQLSPCFMPRLLVRSVTAPSLLAASISRK